MAKNEKRGESFLDPNRNDKKLAHTTSMKGFEVVGEAGSTVSLNDVMRMQRQGAGLILADFDEFSALLRFQGVIESNATRRTTS